MNSFVLSSLILGLVALSSSTFVGVVPSTQYYAANYAPVYSHSASSVAFNSPAVKYNYNVAQAQPAPVNYVVPQQVKYVVPQQVKYVVPQIQQVKYVVPQVKQVKYVVPQVKYVQPQLKYGYQPSSVYSYSKAYPHYYGSGYSIVH